MKLKKAMVAAALLTCCEAAWVGAPQPFSDELFLDWNDLRDLLREQGFDFRLTEAPPNAALSSKPAGRMSPSQNTMKKLLRLDVKRLGDYHEISERQCAATTL